MFVMNCFDEDEAIGRPRVIVARWSSSWHRHHCLFALLLSSSSPCCQPLFLLDCWILAIVVVSLCCCCPRHIVFAMSGGSRLSACPREIVTVEVKLIAHSFLSLTINSLFASGSWLCYSLCYCIFCSFLTTIFIDCHVFTIETTAHCCRLPF